MKKNSHFVYEWFRQAAACYRNENHRETEKNIVSETRNEVVEIAETENDIQLNSTELESEQQLR